MFTIDAGLVATYPQIFALALSARGMDPERLQRSRSGLEEAAEAARNTACAVDSLAQLPAIRAWRDAYARAGVKPSRYRSSIEALLRRAAKGAVPSVMPLVDLYNAASLRHMAPLGAVDADLARGEISLRLCRPDSDSFQPLGASASDYPLRDTIPVYAAGSEILCWCLNARDAAPTALRPDSVNAIFFTEGIATSQEPAAQAALADLGQRLADLGADVSLLAFNSRQD